MLTLLLLTCLHYTALLHACTVHVQSYTTQQAGASILGTRPEDIDRAEDRDKFSAMLDSIGVDQPEWSALTSIPEALAFADRVSAFHRYLSSQLQLLFTVAT
jgi:carbamoylphosphate synthase large subunit